MLLIAVLWTSREEAPIGGGASSLAAMAFGNKNRFPPQSHATSIGEVDFADLLLTRRGMARGEVL